MRWCVKIKSFDTTATSYYTILLPSKLLSLSCCEHVLSKFVPSLWSCTTQQRIDALDCGRNNGRFHHECRDDGRLQFLGMGIFLASFCRHRSSIYITTDTIFCFVCFFTPYTLRKDAADKQPSPQNNLKEGPFLAPSRRLPSRFIEQITAAPSDPP